MKQIFLISALLLLCMTSCKKDEQTQPVDLTRSQVGWAVGANHDGYASLLYTADGGATWERQGNSTLFAQTHLAYVYPYDEQMAFVGGYREDARIALFKTTDGGRTWVPKGENLGSGAIYGFTPISKTGLLACGSVVKNEKNYPAIFQSMDQGDTWSVIYTMDEEENRMLEAIITDYQGNIIALGGGGAGGGLNVYSSDAGKTWKKGIIGAADEVGGVIDASSSANAATLFAAGTEESLSINRSTDFGRTWTLVYTHFSLHMNGVHALNDREIWVAADDMGIYHSTDGGDHWQHEQFKTAGANSEGVSLNILMGVRFLANGQVGCMCGYTGDADHNISGVIIRTVNGGKDWSRQNIPACGGLRRIFFVSTNTRI